MNKYYQMLNNVLQNGREQRNKKGNIRYLTNIEKTRALLNGEESVKFELNV